MSRLFDEMPEELKMLLGIGSISPTDLTGEKEKTREEDFDFENPPLTCPEIPDSVISEEVIKKLVEARKLMLEARDLLNQKGSSEVAFAMKLSSSSPYAQAQWLIFEDYLKDAVVAVNTCLHINDTGDNGIKKVIDEAAHEKGVLAKDFVQRMLIEKTLSKVLGL